MTDTGSFGRLWGQLEPIGRDPVSGGYRRFAWTWEDRVLREWFAGAAAARGLDLTTDRAGNQWAWLGDPDKSGAGVVVGSHLDSVPDGGAFDGPLGVVSAFAALDALRAAGFVPSRPVGVVHFGDEEGARFGVACAGSRLLTGALAPSRALAMRDSDGVTMAEAMQLARFDPKAVGRDPDTLHRIGMFLELHIEQGRGLADLGRPVAVGESIWPHGRWRFELAGEANHAGTTRLADRRDPMLDLAAAIVSARSLADRHGVLATCGKVLVEPNGVNAIPSRVTAWLDARGANADAVRAMVADFAAALPGRPPDSEPQGGGSPGGGSPASRALGGGSPARGPLGGRPPGRQPPADGALIEESWTDATSFDAVLVARLSALLDDAPVLSTGAGHDAGVLASAGVPAAMLFVRNPTGISHSPAEYASRDDCLHGVRALAAVIRDLAG